MDTDGISRTMSSYFSLLREGALKAADIASIARKAGLDPTDKVEIPFADDLAGRVEKLVGPEGIAERIRDLAPRMSREKLCLTIAQEVARSMADRGIDRQKALDQATRTGLAILTEGVLVAPLEGIAEVRIGSSVDSTSTYADVFFAGPIRAAGGTAQAVSVLIADQVRRSLGIGAYVPTDQEVERYVEEFQIYKNTQYRPTSEEIKKVARSCPVCINGEGTEEEEVQGNRDLPRVPTNQVRSGVCLVIAEGILLKAKKLGKITKSLELPGWDWLDDLKPKEADAPSDPKAGTCREDELLEQLISMRDSDESVADLLPDGTDEDGNYMDLVFGPEEGGEAVKVHDEGMTVKVEATMKYIKDLIAGRPVFSHPSRPGGFRLRYGRGRTCGLASVGINPYTLFITERFMATGTQIKIERPGKAGAVTPVDSIEGPTVLLKNGDLVRVQDETTLKSVEGRIRKITDLGEILIPFGEFVENNHPLVQGSYTEDWWRMEVQCALYNRDRGLIADPYSQAYSLEEAMETIRKEAMEPYSRMRCQEPALGIEVLRRELKRCEDESERSIKAFLKEAAKKSRSLDRDISLYDPTPYIPRNGQEAIRTSIELDVPLHPDWTLLWHDISINELNRLRNHIMTRASMEDGSLLMEKDENIKQVLISLCCVHKETQTHYVIGDLSRTLVLCLGLTEDLRSKPLPRGFSEANNIMKAVNALSGIKVMERSPTRIGARMGRPEKADKRQMKPPVHGLFPVGIEGGNQRLLSKAFSSPVEVNANQHECPKCHRISPYLFCPDCRVRNMDLPQREKGREGMLLDLKAEAERAVRTLKMPSIESLPEMKGVKGLISKEKVPERMEKGLLRAKHSVYVFRDGTIRFDMTDITLTHFRPREVGVPVERLRQLGYLKDILGEPLESGDQMLELKVQDIIVNEGAGDYLLKVAGFVDDELEHLYKIDRFYNSNKREDLIGALVIGLAPHTSAGVLCRIVGYTKALGCFGHPYFHAAKRRNCDGDEDAIMLLMDGLLNFSRKFLPEKRGGQMDAPLVLSLRIDPSEVDKEAHNVDVSSKYPLDFYRATLLRVKTNDYWMIRLDSVKGRIGRPEQYEGFGFSNDTFDLNYSPKESVYKTIGVTEVKINKQLELAKLIRAVDEDDVAERVLSTHLLPDLIGNLRSYSQQSFRCTKCGTKYRRIPLSGRCIGMIGPRGKQVRCNNKLVLTVSEGSVRKYLGIAQSISKEYKVSNYLRQRIEIMTRSIDSMFPGRFQETTLDKFM